MECALRAGILFLHPMAAAAAVVAAVWHAAVIAAYFVLAARPMPVLISARRTICALGLAGRCIGCCLAGYQHFWD